ncbi:nitroreductase family protein [Nodularia spumigena]|jgi:nitroreductase|uniref:nitroreductase family protein n=1 Tax=Nodularia spumigena TaxID=70799 RepID=UPI002B1F9BAB|nr:nitroreductase family protein [Nodularia spumigena]MEA5557815.1 nitroreductase family protein [Nodularia spumigena CH309]
MLNIAIHVIKRVVPSAGIIQLQKQYHQVIKFRNSLNEVMLSFLATAPIFSSFYYALISSAFRRETYGVIYGKLKYYENLNSSLGSSYLLRRNIHRLEKGLIMKPRRDIFALDYIEETLESYKYSLENKDKTGNEKAELQWAHDVLKEYFRVVGDHPRINQSRLTFLSLHYDDGDKNYVPYKRDLTIPPSVTYDQFLELCYRRRSVRWYEQKPVPRELIDKAIRAAALSPSACNRQPFEFRVFDEAELVQKVASIPMGTKGFNDNFPAIIAVVGKLSAYFSERDRHVIYIDGALASMSLMYALETLGLSSCSINWPDIEHLERKIALLLNLQPDERVIMLISLGYPDSDGMVPFSQKKSLSEIRRYN